MWPTGSQQIGLAADDFLLGSWFPVAIFVPDEGDKQGASLSICIVCLLCDFITTVLLRKDRIAWSCLQPLQFPVLLSMWRAGPAKFGQRRKVDL